MQMSSFRIIQKKIIEADVRNGNFKSLPLPNGSKCIPCIPYVQNIQEKAF